MNLKQFVNGIMRRNVGNLRDDYRTLRSKIDSVAIDLIQTYGKNLSLQITKNKNNKIWLENDTLYINQFYDDDKETPFPFDEYPLDMQIAILDDIVKRYAKTQP